MTILFSYLLTIVGLSIFETINSIDNAIINAEVLATMDEKSRRWFLLWGFLGAVLIVRGILPWIIIWIAAPALGPVGAFAAALSSNPQAHDAIEHSAPALLTGGGVFLFLLFFHWLFLEKKEYGLIGEKFFYRQGVWFYGVAAIPLILIVANTFSVNPAIACAAIAGSIIFFITHGFKEYAERAHSRIRKGGSASFAVNKIMYLEIIDATFSIDGVLGAFAFTLSVPLILLGNGIGALVVRQLTIRNIESIKKYRYLKNGAMYSIFFLSLMMLADAFGVPIPQWGAPILTCLIVFYFFQKSHRKILV